MEFVSLGRGPSPRFASAVVIAAFAFVVLVAASCRAPGLEDTTFTSLGQGNVSESASLGQQPHLIVFRSRAAWERSRVHYMLDLGPDAERALSSMDFAKQSVVAFTLGGRPSGGYAVTLKAITAGPPPRFELTSRSPGPGEMVIQITTHPFHFVVLNATAVPAGAETVLDGVKTEFERQLLE